MRHLYFENHLGQRISLSDWPIMVQNEEVLLQLSWKPDTLESAAAGSRVSRWSMETDEKDLVVSIICESERELYQTIDRMEAVFRPDLVARQPGRLWWGDSYMPAYIHGHKHGDWDPDMHATDYTLEVYAIKPLWMYEHSYSFVPGDDEIAGNGGRDYAFDYAYDYGHAGASGAVIRNDASDGAEMELLIYGPVANPAITIGNHIYSVRDTLATGETLKVDTAARTIIHTRSNGTYYSVFDKRVSGIFEQVPAGQSTVTWAGTFGFELTLIEERSTPAWT